MTKKRSFVLIAIVVIMALSVIGLVAEKCVIGTYVS